MAELGGFFSALRLALCDCEDVHKFEPILSGLAKGAHKTLHMFNEALNKAQMRVIIFKISLGFFLFHRWLTFR
jgi:hypothetical protein